MKIHPVTLKPKHHPHRFPYDLVIGRNPTTDITLLDEGISREHALILRDDESGEYVIEDLQSTNGTKVNGKRVRSATLTILEIMRRPASVDS